MTINASTSTENSANKSKEATKIKHSMDNGSSGVLKESPQVRDKSRRSNPVTNADTSIESSNTDATMIDLEKLIPTEMPTALPTTGLEHRLRQLREASAQHSQILTQKLASSQSGQNLLHMGSSLSTLPPDLHHLLQQLHPFVATVEQLERDQMNRLEKLVQAASKVQHKSRRMQKANAAADLYADLLAAEKAVQQYRDKRIINQEKQSKPKWTDLDETSSLERASHITLCLLAELKNANEQVRRMTSANLSTVKTNQGSNGERQSTSVPSLRNALEEDTESSQFVMNLAPRVRRLESDTVEALAHALEYLINQIQEGRESESSVTITNSQSEDDTKDEKKVAAPPRSGNSVISFSDTGKVEDFNPLSKADTLLMLGHCMRGLAILGRGENVESIFARVAIMPLIRSKVSMGRLDEGGSRGECAGLFSLLDDIATNIQQAFGSVLCLAENTFCSSTTGEENIIDVDLLTAGVWVPIATALMADPGIKMAIFSPGIASILQSNYVALDTFLADLASRLLKQQRVTVFEGYPDSGDAQLLEDLLPEPVLSKERIAHAQQRIYAHPKTNEFSKKWNLPIYYQLRFGESCARLNKAVDKIQREGWSAQVFAGKAEREKELQHKIGFELSLFVELYDILLEFWRPDVILKPLANRFLRGAVQLLGRIVSFITQSMNGQIKFGEVLDIEKSVGEKNDESGSSKGENAAFPTRAPYCWGDSEDDVAAVAWELTILESVMRNDYVDTVNECFQASLLTEREELRTLVMEVLGEAADQINPVIDKAWNEVIVKLLTGKCAAPLSAVKGVAVMYRMTNRPPPTQPSTFVGAIFRPLKDFSHSFTNRTPELVGSNWKQRVVVMVSDKYAAAVDELLTTVQKTEVALKNRKARRIAAGGMSDGEKLKLQLYLDYKHFSQTIREVGIDPMTVIGVSKLQQLTSEGQSLFQRQENES